MGERAAAVPSPVADRELGDVDGEPVMSAPPAVAVSPSSPPVSSALEERSLFGEAERIAARAASASPRRQYGAIFRAFGDWLAREFGRPPLIGDLDADVIAAYGRHLATSGGRGGRAAAPATARVYLSMVRALARDLGLEDVVEGVGCPPSARAAGDAHRHPPRQPPAGAGPRHDRGQAGLRAAARARGLRTAVGGAARAAGARLAPPARQRPPSPPVCPRQRRPGARGPRSGGRSAGAGGVDGDPSARPGRRAARRAAAVRPSRPPRRAGPSPPLRRRRAPARAPPLPRRRRTRGARPPTCAARLLGHAPARGRAGVPVHEVSARLGHFDLRTTAGYAAPPPERVDEMAEVLDRRHHAARRAGWGV